MIPKVWTTAETLFFRENTQKPISFFQNKFPDKTRVQVSYKLRHEKRIMEKLEAGEKLRVWGDKEIKILNDTKNMKIREVQQKFFPNHSYESVKLARFKFVLCKEKIKPNPQMERTREIIRIRKVQKSTNENFADRLIKRFGFMDVSPSDVVYYCRMATIIRNLSEQKEADRSNTAYMAMLQGGTVVIAGQDFAEQLAAKKMPLVVHDCDGIAAIMEKCWDTVWQKLPMPINQ